MYNSFNKSHFTKCECSSHLLEVERYFYEDVGETETTVDDGFNFVCWNYGHDGNIKGWKERFRWCWRILKTGNPWADSIIASNKNAREIAEFILKNLPKEELNETK